jgi:hypothetical protein
MQHSSIIDLEKRLHTIRHHRRKIHHRKRELEGGNLLDQLKEGVETAIFKKGADVLLPGSGQYAGVLADYLHEKQRDNSYHVPERRGPIDYGNTTTASALDPLGDYYNSEAYRKEQERVRKFNERRNGKGIGHSKSKKENKVIKVKAKKSSLAEKIAKDKVPIRARRYTQLEEELRKARENK